MGGPDVHISACLEGKQGLTHVAEPISGHKHVCQHALLSGLSPFGLITQKASHCIPPPSAVAVDTAVLSADKAHFSSVARTSWAEEAAVIDLSPSVLKVSGPHPSAGVSGPEKSFPGLGGRGEEIPAPGITPTLKFPEAPVAAVRLLLTAANIECFQFSATIAGESAVVLMDTGATDCFVSAAYIKELQFATVQLKDSVTVQLADDQTSRITQTCTFGVNIQGYRSKVTAYVLPQLTGELNLILGMSWLCKNSVSLNCALGEATVRTGTDKAQILYGVSSDGQVVAHCIRVMSAAVTAISQEVPMVSAKHIRKAMKRGRPVFLMLVRPVESESNLLLLTLQLMLMCLVWYHRRRWMPYCQSFLMSCQPQCLEESDVTWEFHL